VRAGATKSFSLPALTLPLLGTYRAFVFIAFLLTGCDEIHQVSDSKHGAFEASIATWQEGFAVAWYDDRDGNPEIYFRLLDENGRAKSPERRLTNDPEFSYEADITATEGGLAAVAWYERLTNGDLRARLGLWTPIGEALWTKIISTSMRNGRNALVRARGSELFVAWIEDVAGDIAEVWCGWWDLQGQPIAPPRRIAPASRTTWNLNAILDETGRAWVVFDAKAGTRNNELFLALADKTSTDVRRLTSDDGFASKYPDLAFSDDRAALSWADERDGNSEIYLFISAAADLRDGLGERARRITNTRAESMGAYVAANGSQFGLAWCDKTPGQHEIYYQPFDSAGNPLAEPHQITHTGTDSLIPAIKPWSNGFALAWNEYAPKGPGHPAGARSEIAFTLVR